MLVNNFMVKYLRMTILKVIQLDQPSISLTVYQRYIKNNVHGLFQRRVYVITVQMSKPVRFIYTASKVKHRQTISMEKIVTDTYYSHLYSYDIY